MTGCEIIAFIYIIAHLLSLGLFFITNAYEDACFAWLNPVWIYKHAKVNWFGASFLALLGNIVIPGIAVVYWMYKLCTVGRR